MRFYERREIQDVLAYLRLISNPRDDVAFARAVNYPRRGVGLTTQEHLAWAEARGMSWLEAAERPDEIPDVRAPGARGLQRFAELVRHFSLRVTQASVAELLEGLVEELDLVRHLQEEGPEGEDRARNVAELDLFLQQIALVADVDRLDPDADAVVLMTLHTAKGLEFPVVFIAGMEEGLFPLARSRDEPEALEEERRLFYVGITRAEDKLSLSWARQRRRAGDFSYNTLSSFVEAVPDELLERRRTERLRLMADSTPHGRRPRPRDEERGARGYEYDYEPDEALNQDLPRFVKGERVVHGTFGSGAVVEISGFGRDLKVTVDFDEVGRKRLLLRYAQLEKDWP